MNSNTSVYTKKKKKVFFHCDCGRPFCRSNAPFFNQTMPMTMTSSRVFLVFFSAILFCVYLPFSARGYGWGLHALQFMSSTRWVCDCNVFLRHRSYHPRCRWEKTDRKARNADCIEEVAVIILAVSISIQCGIALVGCCLFNFFSSIGIRGVEMIGQTFSREKLIVFFFFFFFKVMRTGNGRNWDLRMGNNNETRTWTELSVRLGGNGGHASALYPDGNKI